VFDPVVRRKTYELVADGGAVRAVLMAVVALLVVPVSAAAHAGFISSSPSGDTVLETAPKEIVLRFNQAVKPDSLRLFDGVAEAVPIGKVSQRRPNEIAAPIEADLERGSYTIVWRVISDDVDPVDGFVVFHVGVKRTPEAAAAGGSGGGGDASSIAQVTTVLLAISLAGVVVFAVARRRRLIVPVVALAAGLAVSTGLAIALEDGEPQGAAARAFRADVQMGELAGRVAVAPAGIGANRIDLALPEPTGAEGGYFEVRVRASLPDAGIGPFVFTGIQGDDPSRFAVRQAYLPLPGRWKLEVSARRGLKGRYSGSVSLPVASER